MHPKYDIQTIVSPSQFGGETKNQDRAVFHGPSSVAVLCDGVTTSSKSADAARFLVSQAPSAFEDGLSVITEQLLNYRQTAVDCGIKVDDDLSPQMQKLLTTIAKEKMKSSYQSTFLAVKFTVGKSYVTTKIINFGDSGFFAFTPSGQVLMTNLSDEKQSGYTAIDGSSDITLTPDCDLLVEILGSPSALPGFCDKFQTIKPDDWMLCKAVRSIDIKRPVALNTPKQGLSLKYGQLIVAPKYLLFAVGDNYRRLLYSRCVRTVDDFTAISPIVNFNERGNATVVLPDHYTGKESLVKERFAFDTDFLLCSDGFYRAFANSDQMHQWLKENKSSLDDRAKKKKLLSSLHARLHGKCGDDDISFIYMSSKGGDVNAV